MTAKHYTEGIGRRKTATARVRITKAPSQRIIVNERPIAEYFKAKTHERNILTVLETENAGIDTYEISAKVEGGGLSAQSDAIKLGLARALVAEKSDRRIPLKRAGYLKRDARVVERKKFGLKKARRRPQWAKR